jgi:DNA polymerase elongation subunit (family B)
VRILLLDIETSPMKVYAWGLYDQNIAINQIVEKGYTMCWAAKWFGAEEILFSSYHRNGKKPMLSKIWQLIDEADAIIHYNGTKFDMPTLNQEFILHDLPRPSPYKQIDLLRTARKQFRLPSNKLSYVSEYLGYGDKVKHKGMDLWRECMEGDEEAWKVMEEYNIRDVELLEKIYVRLLPWIDGHPNYGVYVDIHDSPRCPRCGSHHLHRRGYSYTNTMRYQRLHCQDCGAWSRERVNNLDAEQRKNILVEAR